MPLLLYCITQPTPAVNISAGVCDTAVDSREMLDLRAYWSGIADPQSCLGDAEAVKKAAIQYHQVLREILALATPIPFRFPTLLEDEEAMQQQLEAEQQLYRDAVVRLDNTLQYEIVASWPDEQQGDLAAPVSGREYLKRRQEALSRVAAVDAKLKAVSAESVREWRSRPERKTHRWFALLPRENRERFIASLRTAGASEGARLRLSGPWPPSEFVTPRSKHE